DNILGPDAYVVLINRWNTLSDDKKEATFPRVAPNFIVELRSSSSTYISCHRKMLTWINAGVEVSSLILIR
ncbi:1731_t:CDS:2, partial [Dentiscutata erythropus]